MFDEVEDDFAESRRDEIGGVAEEDVAFYLGADGGIAELFVLVLRDGFV